MNDEGDVWVPRTVPWKEARSVARSGPYIDFWQKLVYVGKEDALLLGFARDCQCEERCYGGPYDDEYGDHGPDDACRVPAYHFRIEER